MLTGSGEKIITCLTKHLVVHNEYKFTPSVNWAHLGYILTVSLQKLQTPSHNYDSESQQLFPCCTRLLFVHESTSTMSQLNPTNGEPKLQRVPHHLYNCNVCHTSCEIVRCEILIAAVVKLE